MRSFRDIYRKFIKTKSNNSSSFDEEYFKMPFFYLKNSNFSTLFMRDQASGNPIVILNPNKSLAQLVNQCKTMFRNSIFSVHSKGHLKYLPWWAGARRREKEIGGAVKTKSRIGGGKWRRWRYSKVVGRSARG